MLDSMLDSMLDVRSRRTASAIGQARTLVVAACFAIVAACGGGGGGGSSGGGTTPVTVTAPVIVTQPQAMRVADGQPVSFSVAAVSSVAVTYQWSRNGVAIAGATSATYSIAATQLSDDGATFTVTVSNSGGSVQSAPALLNVSAIAPSIADNVPRTVAVTAGQPATFSVVASGSSPLRFQWRRGGVTIAGATSSTYTIAATAPSDNGATFDVVVTNVAGSVTSALFTLTVSVQSVPPTITTQPQPVTVRVGDPASFTVVAAGTGPLSYQWQRDGNAIGGAQASTYTLASAMLTDNGARFSVVVTNAVGSVTSDPATLTVLPQPGVALVAGNIGGPGGLDGSGTASRFSSPSNVAIDNAGDLFVADASAIREIAANGTVTTFAGSPIASGSVDGPAATARFGLPTGVAADAAGNVFVVDSTNSTIRRITPAGTVSTFAGTSGIVGSSDGNGAAASFNVPVGIAIDAAGNLYVADTGNSVIREITPAGLVSTIAGTAGVVGSLDGPGTAAQFSGPRNVAVDAAGTVDVADTGNNTIRMIAPGGVVTTLAGSPTTQGSVDGVGSAASFSAPSGIAVDASGIVYVGDDGTRILRRIAAGGVVSTLAGTANVIGSADGTGSTAQFALPSGLASDASGVLYVADRDNDTIRKVSSNAVVSTIAGAAILQGTADGPAGTATFNVPFGVVADAVGNVYIADYFNSTIRKLTVAGVVSTLAGSPRAPGSADGSGAAARFATPQGLAIDAAGNVYVADKSNQIIRKVTPAGVVTTLAGSPGVRGAADGIGAAASFNDPSSLAVDAAGNVFVADNNPTVRRITPAGVVTTVAGAAGRVGALDGPGNVASFRFPQGLAIDAAGNLYVADSGNAIVRKVTSAGDVSTIAGAAGVTGTMDGPAATARFTLPTGIAVDAAGNVYVSDITAHTIRKIDTGGNVSTPVGIADGIRGVRPGALPGHLDLPVQLALDRFGNLYCTDANGVLRITFP